MAMLRRDWENVKCNPLYLFIKSIGAPNSVSSKDFQTCVAKYGGRHISPAPCTPINKGNNDKRNKCNNDNRNKGKNDNRNKGKNDNRNDDNRNKDNRNKGKRGRR